MAGTLALHLMGSFQVLRDGAPVAGFESDQVRALLAYLAVERDRPHRREALADLLWPDEPQEVAAHRLRQALANLRLVLGDRDAAEPVLRVSRADVQLSPSGALWSDLATLRDILAAVRGHRHLDQRRCRPCAARLERAAALVRGRFLEGLSLSRSAPFADWATAQRERLHERACAVLEALVAQHERRGDRARALALGRRVLELDSWRESGHRAVMRCLAAQGDRAGALRQYRLCERLLNEELGVEPEAETGALRAAIAGGTFRPEPTGAPAPLPAQRTRFIGRAGELATALELVACERLVTLTGPGGTGKTRLALRLAEELTPDLPGRLWLVELDRVADQGLVPAAIAGALGLDARAPGDPIDRVVERIGEADALLLLDNCEHVRSACARAVARLLRDCPRLSILATSRERLHAPGEAAWPVVPLGLPPCGPAGDGLEAVAGAEAVALFVDRAQRARPTFALRPENARAVAGICRLLEGVPLAIELAASWARLLAPETLLGKLDGPLGLGSREGAPTTRHRSLRDVLDWSYALLSERERRLFPRLAVFAGGWTLEMAEAVCADESGELAERELLDALGGLHDKSLVVAVDESGGARYRFLEPVRQYAAELLEASDEVPRLRERHARCVLALVEDAAPRLRSAEQVAWLDRLEREQPNVRAALDHLARGPAALALRLAGALAWFWNVRGHWREGLARSRCVLALAGAGAGADQARARVLCGAALLEVNLGAHDLAARDAAESLACFRAIGDQGGEADALNALGLAELRRGDGPAAEASFERALGIAEARADRWGIGRAAWNVGDCARRRGDLATARAHLERAVAEFTAGDLRIGLGLVLGELARVASDEGARAEARALYRNSLTIHRTFGIRYGVVHLLRSLAGLEVEEGATAAARGWLEEALATARELGMSQEAARIAVDLDALARAPTARGRAHLTALRA